MKYHRISEKQHRSQKGGITKEPPNMKDKPGAKLMDKTEGRKKSLTTGAKDIGNKQRGEQMLRSGRR